MPNSVSDLNQTHVLEWHVLGPCTKNGYPKDKCLKQIGVHAYNTMIILGLIINISGGCLSNHLMGTRSPL